MPVGRCSPWRSTTMTDRPRSVTSRSERGSRSPTSSRSCSRSRAPVWSDRSGASAAATCSPAPAEDTLLAQIVSAVDGPIQAGDFGEPHTNGACDHEGQCVLLALWADVGSKMKSMLEAYSLADLTDITRRRRAVAGRDRPGLTAVTDNRSSTRVSTCRPAATATSKVTSAPVPGWTNASHGRGGTAGDRQAGPLPAVHRIADHGWPIERQWTRIWWVRPVSSSQVSELTTTGSWYSWSTRVVGARRPAVDGDGHAEGITAGPADRRIDHAAACSDGPRPAPCRCARTAWDDSWSTRST